MTRAGYPTHSALRHWNENGKLYTRISDRERRIARIPVCPNCGVRCSACRTLKNGQAFADQPKQCCLIVAKHVYPDNGESGETYDVEMCPRCGEAQHELPCDVSDRIFAGKPE